MKVGDLRASIIDKNVLMYDHQGSTKFMKFSKGEIVLLLERTPVSHLKGYEHEIGGCWTFLKEGQIFLLPAYKILQWTRAFAAAAVPRGSGKWNNK